MNDIEIAEGIKEVLFKLRPIVTAYYTLDEEKRKAVRNMVYKQNGHYGKALFKPQSTDLISHLNDLEVSFKEKEEASRETL